MYPNEGAVDSTAVRMSQMVGVFLAGLGVASVTMRPAELDATDVQQFVDRLNSTVSSVDKQITKLSNSNATFLTEMKSAVHTMEAIDMGPLEGLVSSLSDSVSSTQTTVQQVLAVLGALDLDVDLSPLMAALDRNLAAINEIDFEVPDLDLSAVLQAIDSTQAAQNVIIGSLGDIQRMVPDTEAMDGLAAAISDNLSAIQDHRQAFDGFIDTVLKTPSNEQAVQPIVANVAALAVDLSVVKEAVDAVQGSFDEFTSGILGVSSE